MIITTGCLSRKEHWYWLTLGRPSSHACSLVIEIINPREMLHDPSIYPDPMAFNPDRYRLDDSEMQKVTDLVFGFGRRACPGFHFALGTLYAIVLTTLAICDILPALDENGKEIVPTVKYSSGTIRYK